jgi:hypothetical protein
MRMGVGNDGTGSIGCEGGGPYAVPKPLDCHLGWGDRFTLDQGSAPVSHCHGDTNIAPHTSPGNIPGVPILDYGQTRSAGAITCESEPTGVTCTDSGTRHYIRLSREANELGWQHREPIRRPPKGNTTVVQNLRIRQRAKIRIAVGAVAVVAAAVSIIVVAAHRSSHTTTTAPPQPSVAQRLQELETQRATAAISEPEYTVKREQIISEIWTMIRAES